MIAFASVERVKNQSRCICIAVDLQKYYMLNYNKVKMNSVNTNFESACFLPPDNKRRYVSSHEMEVTEEVAFYGRMATFVGSNWALKPRRVAPPVCVMYGWQVIKENVLKCVSCCKILSGHLPPSCKAENYDKAVNDLEDSIRKDCHDEFCPWPLNPSQDNFLRSRLKGSSDALADLTERIASLINIADALPTISPQIPAELRIDQDKLDAVRELLKLPSELNHEALILALTGWTLAQAGKFDRKRLKCEQCFRVVELSFFIASPNKLAAKLEGGGGEPHTPVESTGSCDERPESRSSTSSVENGNGVPPLKRQKFYNHDIKAFNPLKEHQRWCPWIDEHCPSLEDEVEKFVCGWRTLTKILFDKLQQHLMPMDLVQLRKRVLQVISAVKSC